MEISTKHSTTQATVKGFKIDSIVWKFKLWIKPQNIEKGFKIDSIVWKYK